MLNTNKFIPNILYANSSKIMEFQNPMVNYHPQNHDQYYQDTIPSYIEIREFNLEENKQKIAEYIRKLLSTSTNNNLDDYEKDEIVKKLLSKFPTKAYIVSTDNIRMLITQYDRVKSELSSAGNNISNLKPGSLLYYAISTAYSIEKNNLRWFNNIKEDLFKERIDVDILGSNSYKDFVENASYDPISRKIAFGTFISYKDKKVYNATQDTDIVIHELGHAILDHLRPSYMDNIFDLESQAIHEAFSDINAFLHAAMDRNIKVKPEDLDRPNPISSIAEYLGSIFNTQNKIKKEILENDFLADLEKISDNKPIRELSQIKEYKPYSKLIEKIPHSYSLALSTTFYRAFTYYAKEIGDVHKAAEEFFKVFAMGTKISPVASSTMPEFYKSIIIADIIYNGSKLSKYLIKAANESKLLNTSIEQIQNEITNSKSLDVSEIKQEIQKAKNVNVIELYKKLEKSLLNFLKANFPEFSLVKDIKVNIYPGINNHLNLEATYVYPVDLKYDNKSVVIYGGVLLVFDDNLNLVYSHIEKLSIEKVAKMKDYMARNIIF
ncbi:MAG: hypothetical protein RMJ51_05370 [Candidatus Calescibacterium sp.]|nr:hypothetical protein [Candidatus Calescibacterium sp.]MCX7972458.1 hypothetical protein [bacterium]MDW8195650.1 hypothetical protein [Candidatus Calescibacterium sp.]